MLVTYAGSQAVNQTLYAKLPFDPVRDLETVATIARTPFLLVVAASSPIRDLRDLIAGAKAKPGTITYATLGNGSINHLLQLGAWGMTDVIDPQVDNAFAAVASAINLVRGGKLRAVVDKVNADVADLLRA